MASQRRSFKGSLLVLGSALCFASYGVWARLLSPQFSVFNQAWVRGVLILLVLLPIALFGKRLKVIRKEDRKWFAITMICTVFTQAPVYYAFNHLPLGTATFIFYGFFLITSYAVGWAFLAEKMTRIKIVSLFMGFTGLAMTFGWSLQMFSLAAVSLAALNGISSGGEVASSKKSTDRYSSFQITFYSWFLVLATHLPLSFLLGETQVAPAWNVQWMAMVGYAIAGLGGFWLVIEGFKSVDASVGGLIGLLEIPLSAWLGVYLFNDQMTWSELIGGFIIIAAAVLPDVYSLRHPKEKPVPPPPLL